MDAAQAGSMASALQSILAALIDRLDIGSYNNVHCSVSTKYVSV